METIAVFVDDAAYALKALKPMAEQPTQWLLVVCTPRLTRRIGKWVSHSNREQWRAKWAAKLVGELKPMLGHTPGSTVDSIVATRPLSEVTPQLRARLGPTLRVLDARRPKLDPMSEPLADAEANEHDNRWALPIAVSSSLGVVLALTD